MISIASTRRHMLVRFGVDSSKLCMTWLAVQGCESELGAVHGGGHFMSGSYRAVMA